MEKPSTFAKRLDYLMRVEGLSKSDLARICGIDKSNITRYCKGEYEAKQDVVYAMATKLNVDAAWLMGYDVPMREEENQELRALAEQTVEEHELIRCWRMATDKERQNIAFILRDYGMPFPKAEPETKASLSSGA